MSIRSLLQKARDLRERGKPLPALDAANQIIFAAQKKNNHAAIAQALIDRSIVFRHLFEQTGDVSYAILSRKDAESIMELVKQFGLGEKLHTAYCMLGQAALLFLEYDAAENYFYKSLKYFKGNPAEKGSWRYHWGKSLYFSGQKEKGILAFASAIADIKKYAGKTDRFLINVWLSGAYLNFALVLMKDNPQQAKKYLAEAGAIIRSDKRLVVRKKQFARAKKLFRA